MSKQIARRTSDRVIEQYGEGIGDRAGCVIENITQQRYDTLLGLLAQANGGVVANANGTFTALAAPAPAADPLAPKRARLVDLRTKGWSAMTAAEKTEAQQLVFELAST